VYALNASWIVKYLGKFLALVLAASTLGCGDDDPSRDEELGFRVELSSSEGGAPEHFRVVLAVSGSMSRASCPDGGGALIRCARGGFTTRELAAGTKLTVKAPGFEFVTRELAGEELDAGALRLALTRLPEFVAEEDYRTGMESAESEARFQGLAAAFVTELGPVESAKFIITNLDSEPRVYFQNTRSFPGHYEFAEQVLGITSSRADFAQRTYQGESRRQMAGTLEFFPELELESRALGGTLSRPIALEFFPSDDLSPGLVLRAHRLLEERLGAPLEAGDRRLVYVPAGSVQEQQLAAAESEFAEQDVLFSDHVEFYAGLEQQILNPGLSYGTLLRVTPEELEQRVVSFRELLVLTRLPNELPLVGGTITEELQTPLAHVNLAARARGTPNLALKDAGSDPCIAPLLGKLVRFEVTKTGFSLEETTLEEAEEFWASRAGDPLVPEGDLEFDELSSFEDMGFDDAIRFGAKAANLAELRHLLGEQAPPGFAVPFSAYRNYLRDNHATEALCIEAGDDCAEEGRSAELCDAARARCDAATAAEATFEDYSRALVADPELVTDAPLREACLDGLAYLVQHGDVDPDFAAALDARVVEVLGTQKVRLRSSTNAEDLPGFSGAGLYDSVSAEGSGKDSPSNEIRKVWASVFRFRAFEERSLWNVDHDAIQMGVAVNPAVDDEAANGVLVTQNIPNPSAEGYYVNVQQGEVEVTNPENGAIPEVFSIVPAPSGERQVLRQRFSSLSPTAPLLTDAEIGELHEASSRVQSRFAKLYDQAARDLPLDLEFKVFGPERRLWIKQARPYFSR
jgi:pyruvate,water dikinase